ncbi:MAG: MFS transporter [Armatimonadota bacterium]|nr:MFS transporter [Armatimonadota bacterium]
MESDHGMMGTLAKVQTPHHGITRVLYGLGSLGGSLLLQTVLLWIFFYYSPPPGSGLPPRVAPGLVGVAMAAGRLIDALADLPVAFWSDRVRTRWGRRKPFIVLGSPFLVLSFFLLWSPPKPHLALENFLYLTLLLSSFFFLFTLVMNPYAALLPEITAGGRGRVTTAAWQAAFNLIGVGGAFVLSSWLSMRYGFPRMALILGGLALLALWAAGSVREEELAEGAWGIRQVRQVIREVLAMKSFQIYLVGLSLMWFGLSMVNLSLVYFITILMGLPKEKTGHVLAVSLLCTLAGTPLVPWTVKTLGKRRTLLAALGVILFVLPLLSTLGLWPFPLSPAVQGYLLVAASGLPLAVLFVLPNALLADIAEDHGKTRGVRHEALFFAFQGLVFNGTTSLAAATLGGILQVLGYAPPHALGLRAVPMVAAAFVATGAIVFLRYPEKELYSFKKSCGARSSSAKIAK